MATLIQNILDDLKHKTYGYKH